MIKGKIIELENVGFYQKDNEWKRVNAGVTLDANGEDPELEIHLESVKIAISVEDIITCLQELDIDIKAYTDY